MEQGEQAASQWECAICFEALRIEQSVVTSCGRKADFFLCSFVF
jgi:hypothetical protein